MSSCHLHLIVIAGACCCIPSGALSWAFSDSNKTGTTHHYSLQRLCTTHYDLSTVSCVCWHVLAAQALCQQYLSLSGMSGTGRSCSNALLVCVCALAAFGMFLHRLTHIQVSARPLHVFRSTLDRAFTRVSFPPLRPPNSMHTQPRRLRTAPSHSDFFSHSETPPLPSAFSCIPKPQHPCVCRPPRTIISR